MFLITMNSSFELDIEKFHTELKSETDLSGFLRRIKEIAARFSILDEGNNLNGCFTTILTLSEQYNHELLLGHREKEHVHT